MPLPLTPMLAKASDGLPRGDEGAWTALVDAGRRDAAREEAALAVATIALRQPSQMLAWLEANAPARDAMVALLRDGFDMLEEDLAEEAFFASTRATYWTSTDTSQMRAITATLIDKLEF